MQLPSKGDRLWLYRRLEAQVQEKITSLEELQDTRPQGWRKHLQETLQQQQKLEVSGILRDRQIHYLKHELLPLMAAALLLSIQDTEAKVETMTTDLEDQEDTSDRRRIQEIDCVSCMALLISNTILLAKGQYDARLRHIVKAVCVPILAQLDEAHTSHKVDEKNASKRLYFLTDSTSSSDEHDEAWFQESNASLTLQPTVHQNATQLLEHMEQVISIDILQVLILQQQQQEEAEAAAASGPDKPKAGIIKRTLQIGTVSLVVGGMFAITGGLATPGLVAALGALGVGSAGAGSAIAIPAFAALTTTHAMASMFGVVGGGLAAYKMKKRTQGLSEWRIRKETIGTTRESVEAGGATKPNDETSTEPTSEEQIESPRQPGVKFEPERKSSTAASPASATQCRGLHATVCVSGWLQSKTDFQTPFGIQADDPQSDDMLELLQRFFAVHAPHKVSFCEELLKIEAAERKQRKKERWQRMVSSPENSKLNLWQRLKQQIGPLEEDPDGNNLWSQLRHQYGSDPDHLVPLPQRLSGEAKKLNLPTIGDGGDISVDTDVTEPTVSEEDSSVMQAIPVEAEQRAEPSLDHEEKLHIITTYAMTQSKELEAIYENNSMLVAMDLMNAEISPFMTGEDEATMNNETSERDDDAIEKKEELFDDIDLGGTPARTLVEEEKKEDPKIDGDMPATLITSSLEDIEKEEAENQDGAKKKVHSHLVWDWGAHYNGELYTVTWETTFLLKLCRVIEVLFLEISNQVSKQVLQNAVLGAAAAVPSALATAANVIDDPYQIISLRSEKAGLELAHCLLMSDEGRPVSLVGFSFGARVVFSCLLELARHQAIWEMNQRKQKSDLKRKKKDDKPKNSIWSSFPQPRQPFRAAREETIEYKREPASLVEDVILIGLPRLVDTTEWVTCRELVSGRFINCYNKSDWMLSYMINIRCWNGVSRVCGTNPIAKVGGVENFEVSHLAPSHGRYRLAVPHILHEVGYGTPFGRNGRSGASDDRSHGSSSS